MAYKIWDEIDWHQATFSDKDVAIADGTLKLRCKDLATDEYNPYGLYDQAIIVLPNFAASALHSYFAFDVEDNYDEDEDENPLGTVEYQVSNDGGTVYQYWNGTAWAVAAGTNWNTKQQIDAHIATFSVGAGRQIRFKLRISPSADLKHTPHVVGIVLCLQFVDSYVYHEDLLRSLKRYIDTNIEISRTVEQTLAAASASVLLIDKFTIYRVLTVYNLTTDPGRLTNLYSSFSGMTVTMTASQALGSNIEVTFMGRCPVYLSADADLIKSSLPAFAIEENSEIEQRALRRGGQLVEKNRSGMTARLRDAHLYLRSTLQIHCLAEYKIPTQAMSDALRKITEYTDTLYSLATGYPFAIMEVVPYRGMDRIKDGLYDAGVAMDISGIEPQLPYRTAKLVQELRLRMRPDPVEVING
jgi:hypothetical protein